MVGRVAAIINRRANERWNCHQVRFGWFDFIDDIAVSSALLQAVEKWGQSKGMTEIAGPLGFIDTDREGMLVDGFDQLSTMYVNYNYPYYPQHMEQMQGFKKDNDYVEMKVKVPEVVPEKFSKITEMVRKRYGLRVHKFTRKELIDEGWGYKIFDLLNATYKRSLWFQPVVRSPNWHKLVNDYIKIADLNLVTGIMDGDKLVGFGITFPRSLRLCRRHMTVVSCPSDGGTC